MTLVMYLFLLEASDLFAIYFGKMYSLTDKLFYLLLCSFCWGISGIFFSLSLKYQGAAIINTFWIALSTIAAVALGVLYFKEQVSTFQYVAIGIIIVGIVVLFLKTPTA